VTLAARDTSGNRPQLRLVRGAFRTVANPADWQRVAQAVLACTHELARHLLDQRWVRVDEVMRERRELLFGMEAMTLDIEGRRCLMALTQATEESEAAIAQMSSSQASHRSDRG
jgi:hypothetical protein